jgi:eukaryotic-like serine/threonine-protein kinase
MNVASDEQVAQRIQFLVSDARKAAHGAARLESASVLQPNHIGVTIPGYVLHEVIHRGGQGTVYEATQSETGTRVAVKIMHDRPTRHADDIFRFKREVEILSRLRHPGVVTLFDGGIEDGRIFLVMELIRGKPIDEFVQDKELSIDDCLRLFLSLCEAVGEAHVCGVVHRDLKPSNILVDEEGFPHVLDFGLAKPLSTEQLPTLTETGAFVGSLAWTSPEQASGCSDEVDIRADVHALGLILYKNLTGESAFVLEGSVPAMLERVIHETPQQPSDHQPTINDEVETIVLKCLQKDRMRRYQSANELALDVRRYLDGYAIEAKRDSTFYVLRKTLRRHRLSVASAVLFAFVLMAYGITTTFLLGDAQEAKRVAESQTENAAAKYKFARETLEFLVNEVSTELSDIPPAREARSQILKGAYVRLLELLDENDGDPLLDENLARTHLQIGDIALILGDPGAAQEQFQQARAIYIALLESRGFTPERARQTALAHIRLGDSLKDLRNLDDALREYDKANLIIERVAETTPNIASSLSDIGWSLTRRSTLLRELGRGDESYAMLERQLIAAENYVGVFPESADAQFLLFMTYRLLAEACSKSNDQESRKTWNEAALPIGEQLLSQYPDNLLYARRVAVTYLDCARTQISLGQYEVGDVNLENARQLMERVVSKDPEAMEGCHGLATCYLEQAHRFSRSHDWQRSSTSYERSALLFNAIRDNETFNASLLRSALRASYGAAWAHYSKGDTSRSQQYALETVDIAEVMLESTQLDQVSLKFYADFLRLVGRRVLPDVDAAIDILDRMGSLVGEAPTMTRLAVARAYCSMERYDIGASEYAPALAEISDSLEDAQRSRFRIELRDCIDLQD